MSIATYFVTHSDSRLGHDPSLNNAKVTAQTWLSDNLRNGRFHAHLRDLFAPQVARYVDLMESSIGQSIHKGFEKEKWEVKG